MRIAFVTGRGESCLRRPSKGLLCSLFLCLLLISGPLSAGPQVQVTQAAKSAGNTQTQKAHAKKAQANKAQANAGIVTVMSGTTHDGNTTIVQDMAAALGDGDAFRVIPMVGQGPAQTLKDVMTLRGVDMGITQSTVLNHFARSGELGPIRDQVVYVAKLFNEDMHLLARSEIKNIAALKGKTVNIGLEGSGTEIAARFLFSTLGVSVRETQFDAAKAIAKLQSGDIDAAVLIGTTPSPRIKEVAKNSGLKLLAIPFAKGLEDDTYPAVLTHVDYPALIAPNERIDTIAVCAVLIALRQQHEQSSPKGDPAGDLQDRLEKFVERFFSKFDALQEPPSHPKWQEVNFAATLEDWRRAPEAQAWLDSAKKQAQLEAREKDRFQSFLAQAGQGVPSAEQQEKLFRAFKAWNARQASQ